MPLARIAAQNEQPLEMQPVATAARRPSLLLRNPEPPVSKRNEPKTISPLIVGAISTTTGVSGYRGSSHRHIRFAHKSRFARLHDSTEVKILASRVFYQNDPQTGFLLCAFIWSFRRN